MIIFRLLCRRVDERENRVNLYPNLTVREENNHSLIVADPFGGFSDRHSLRMGHISPYQRL